MEIKTRTEMNECVLTKTNEYLDDNDSFKLNYLK